MPENAAAGALSGSYGGRQLAGQSLAATQDPDTYWLYSHGASQTWSYSLSGSPAFAVCQSLSAPLVLYQAQAVVNFETQNSYLLSATVSDASSSSGFVSLSASQPVALYVLDVNEAPSIGAQACTVREQTIFNSAPPGTTVSCNGVAGGALIASDPDTPGSTWANLVWSITDGNDAGLFEVTNAGLVKLTSKVTCCSGAASTASSLDFESALGNSFSLTVRVTDGGSLYSAATVVVSLIDVNEPPVLLGPFVRSVTENLVGPQTVGAPVAVYDEDVGQRESFTMSGNGSSFFAIDGCSGQISLLAGKWLDYEAAQTPGASFDLSFAPLRFLMAVTVTDNGLAPITAGLTSTASYVIRVVDADDPPVFVTQSLSVTLAENSASGAAVSAAVTVTDQDVFGGYVPWFNQTFSIAGGNGLGIFAATTSSLAAGATQPNSLTLVVANSGPAIAGTSGSPAHLQWLNFEDPNQNRFPLLVTATDGGGMSSSATVLVSLTDVNEAPAFTDVTFSRKIDETCAGVCASRSAGLSVTLA